MNDFSKILNWVTNNIFKIIFLSALLLALYLVIIIASPFFHFFSFINNSFNEFQDIFEEIDKYLKEFDWKKPNIPQKDKDEA